LWFLVGLLLLVTTSAHAIVWGIKTHDPISGPPSTLFTFTEDGGSLTVIGIITVNGVQIDADGLALSDGGKL
jgi:hypothetical protein